MNTNTIQTMWDTRPARIPSSQGGNAKIAGVCEGIGVRYQVDPTLIRILFVAASLVGGGLGVYLVAWLIMPRYSTQHSPLEAVLKNLGEEYKKEKETGWWLIVALVVFGFSATSTDDGLFGSSAVISLALAFAAWYFLHTKQPEPPHVDSSLIAPAPGFQAPTPPSWDPLGTVPQLWHLPEPGTIAPEPPQKKKSYGWLWVAGAVIIVGLTGIANVTVGSMEEPNGVGDVETVVYSESDLQPRYENGVGNLTLDLRELEPLDQDHTVKVDNGIGNVTIKLPTEVPVRLECNNGIGDTNCEPGLHNPGEGHVLTIKVDNGIGKLDIEY